MEGTGSYGAGLTGYLAGSHVADIKSAELLTPVGVVRLSTDGVAAHLVAPRFGWERRLVTTRRHSSVMPPQAMTQKPRALQATTQGSLVTPTTGLGSYNVA